MEISSWPIVATVVLAVLPFIIEKGTISPMSMQAAKMALFIIGFAVCDEIFGAHLWPVYGVSLCALLLGYYLFAFMSDRKIKMGKLVLFRPADGAAMPLLSGGQLRALKMFSGFVMFLVIYHFAVGGIPILSSGLETARFDFVSSGLFGIPGRMMAWGLPFVVFCVSIYSWRTRDKRAKWLLYAVWTVYLLSSFMSGFKSSVLGVLNLYVIYRMLISKPLKLRDLLNKQVIVLLALSMLYAVWMLHRYSAGDIGDMASTIGYFGMRLTAIPAQPGHLAMTDFSSAADGHSYMLQDLSYFMARYFHIGSVGPDVFPLDKIVSAATFGVKLQEGQWIVPVTVGAFPQLFVEYGLAGGLLAMFVEGVLFALSIYRSMNSTNPYIAAAWGLVVLIFTEYFLNGNLIFCVINLVAVLVFLAVLRVMADVIATGRIRLKGTVRKRYLEPLD